MLRDFCFLALAVILNVNVHEVFCLDCIYNLSMHSHNSMDDKGSFYSTYVECFIVVNDSWKSHVIMVFLILCGIQVDGRTN